MNYYKNVVILMMKIFISGALSLLIISFFLLGYLYSGIHVDNTDGSTDYKSIPYQYHANMKEGFSWGRMDGNGYSNTDTTGAKNNDILFMGSSHTEGGNIKSEDRFPEIVKDRFADKNCYNIGVSGHTIYRCIDNIRRAYNKYLPNDFLIIETDTVNLDMEKMDAVNNGSAEKIPSYDHGIIYYLQKIPAIKWIYKEGTEWIKQSKSIYNTEKIVDEYNDVNDITYSETVLNFLNIGDVTSKTKVIIFYQPNTKINENGNYVLPNKVEKEKISIFEDACNKNNIIFYDFTYDFKKLYDNKHKLAHGFCNTEVGIGHLNKEGHRVIAEKLIEIMTKELEGK